MFHAGKGTPTLFNLEVLSHRDQLARLVVYGELDFAGAARLEATFRWVASVYGAANVHLELEALEFCDCGGWRALERCRDQGATLIGSPPCLRRLHCLLGLAHVTPADLRGLRGVQPGHAQTPTETARVDEAA